MIKTFASEKSGNVAMMFGLFIIPILIGGGVALDMMRIHEARSHMSEAADSGVLAAARSMILDDSLTIANAEEIARRYFDANGATGTNVEIQSFSFVYDAAAKVYRLTVQGRMKTTLMGITGYDWAPINIVTEAAIAPPRALEVVLVLDNTGSMSGQKIVDLRDAATSMVNAIMADTNNEVLVGVVPFAKHVNMGRARGGEPWLDVPADYSYDRQSCSVDEDEAEEEGCTEQSSTCYNNEGNAYSCIKWQCPGGGNAPTTCTTVEQPITWEGCVGSRDHPWNIRDEQFDTRPVPGVLNHPGGPDCPNIVLPMTDNKTDVLAAINAMSAWGDTYIPSGLTWGLRLVSSPDPFSEGDMYESVQAQAGIKAIVLMTDGENTASPHSNGSHYNNNVAQADQYTLELCDEIKSKDIILYTVAFDITNSDTLDMISNCATNPDAYFNAADANALSDAFGVIGNSLTELALTK